MSASEEVVLGVVAGILTSGVLALLGLFVTRIFLPWYRELVYRGVDLDGDWRSELQTQGARYAYEVHIRQTGHELTGTATINKSGAGLDDYNDVFDLDGFTWEGYVSLTLRSKNRKRLSFATALFRVEDRGSRMRGHWAYRGSRSDEVESEPILLTRLA